MSILQEPVPRRAPIFDLPTNSLFTSHTLPSPNNLNHRDHRDHRTSLTSPTTLPSLPNLPYHHHSAPTAGPSNSISSSSSINKRHDDIYYRDERDDREIRRKEYQSPTFPSIQRPHIPPNSEPHPHSYTRSSLPSPILQSQTPTQPQMARHDSYPYRASSIAPPERPGFARGSGSSSYYLQSVVDKALSDDETATGTGTGANTPVKKGEKRSSKDLEELTTKGKKRKRLAKACSACHKNKRRCDGFAPCSNCEFSNRQCLYLNAQGEAIPPPRTRDSSDAPNASTTEPSSRKGSNNSNPATDTIGRGRGSDGHKAGLERRILTPLEAVDNDFALSSELINIFFKTTPPFGAMFHPPTFHHRLYLGQVSTILLDVIYAYAARSCTNPLFLVTIPGNQPVWLKGELFAERAHLASEKILSERRLWTEDEIYENRGTWEEVELIQAFVLMSIYFAGLRQQSLALFYLDSAITILNLSSSSTTSFSLPLSPTSRNSTKMDEKEYSTLIECRNRTFWLVCLHDLCAAANGREKKMKDTDVAKVPLPSTEAWWVRNGGGLGAIIEGKRRDGLVVGSGSWLGEEGAVGELGHILRILSIFSEIMTIANGRSTTSGKRPKALHEHQEALKSWALSLPTHLRFDEHNLSQAITRLQSPVNEVSFSGWAYAYMHAVAECGMFYLQAAVAQQPGAAWTAQRQSQAVENIAVILDALGEKGREGPLMIFPIAVVSNWQDHIRSTAPATPQRLHLDERLSVWWTEIKRQWGSDRAQVLDKGFYPGMIPDGSSSRRVSRTLPERSTPHQRYSRDISPTAAPDFTPVAGMTRSTSFGSHPSPSTFEAAGIPYPSVLEPIRPRAASSVSGKIRSPSPVTPDHAQIPGFTSGTLSPKKSDRGSGGRMGRKASKSGHDIKTSAGGDDWSIWNAKKPIRAGWEKHDHMDEEAEVGAGSHKARVMEEEEEGTRRENGVQSAHRGYGEPLGIAALISAAEEREREDRESMERASSGSKEADKVVDRFVAAET